VAARKLIRRVKEKFGVNIGEEQAKNWVRLWSLSPSDFPTREYYEAQGVDLEGMDPDFSSIGDATYALFMEMVSARPSLLKGKKLDADAIDTWLPTHILNTAPAAAVTPVDPVKDTAKLIIDRMGTMLGAGRVRGERAASLAEYVITNEKETGAQRLPLINTVQTAIRRLARVETTSHPAAATRFIEYAKVHPTHTPQAIGNLAAQSDKPKKGKKAEKTMAPQTGAAEVEQALKTTFFTKEKATKEREVRQPEARAAKASVGPSERMGMSAFDRYRLEKLRTRSPRIQRQLGQFVLFLQMSQRTLPLPTVKAWEDAIKKGAGAIEAGGGNIPPDYKAPAFRNNIFVYFRRYPMNPSQMYVPSLYPAAYISKKDRRAQQYGATIPKQGLAWSPSLELISREDLHPASLWPEALAKEGKRADWDLPSGLSTWEDMRVGFPNFENRNANMSWYQLLFGYIGADRVKSPWRNRARSGKYDAYGVLFFEESSDGRPVLVKYFPPPRKALYAYKPPALDTIKKNPRVKSSVRRKSRLIFHNSR
jgi:hypothetical protein